MIKFLILLFTIIIYNSSIIAMDKKPYHHYRMELLETQKDRQLELAKPSFHTHNSLN